MAFSDLREWLSFLEGKGQVKHIKAEVDWDEELGAIAREVAARKGPAMLFENIKDYKSTPCHRLMIGSLGAKRRVRWALGLPMEMPDQEVTRWVCQKMRQPVAPVALSSGPVKENILKGEKVNLWQLPVPKWNPGDGGRYIMTSTSVVTRDPENGQLNVGTYRGMIVDKNKIAVFLVPNQDWGKHFTKYQALKKPMPVAVALGWDPILYMCSATPLPSTFDEYFFCGGLRGKPIELVCCETNDLLVPASAEIVLEGFIDPDPATFQLEGPYTEYTGYYAGGKLRRPVFQVEAITFRHDPIFWGQLTGATPGRYPSDGTWLKYFQTAVSWNYLEDAGIPGILDFNFDGWPEIVKVRIKKGYRNHAQQLAAALWGSKISNHMAKIVIVVDEDIDIRNREALDWAMAYRVNPAMRDISFYDLPGSPLDPSIPFEIRNELEQGQGTWRRTLIDATISWDFPHRPEYNGSRYPPKGTDVSPAMKERVQARWKEYGLGD